MTGVEDDLRQLQDVPLDGLRDWVDSRFAQATEMQWWGAVFEMVESSVSIARTMSSRQRCERFDRGARLVMVAIDREDVCRSMGAYWLLRLASNALRFDPRIDGLPTLITPDGAARYALGAIPLSRSVTVEYAAKRREQYLNADDDFYAPVGISSKNRYWPSAWVAALQDTERIMSWLQRVRDSITDEELKSEVDAWLEIETLL